MKEKDKQKKLFLIFNGRFPSEKAAALFAAKSAESFAEEGIEVNLLVPRRLGRVRGDIFTYYKLKRNFKIIHLPLLDFFCIPFLGNLAFAIGHITFATSCLFYVLLYAQKEDIIYSNETIPLLLPAYFFPNTFYELHNFPEKNLWMYRILFRKVWKILVTNKWKLKKLKEAFNIPKNKMFYEPNAVEIEAFNISLSQQKAREELGLSFNKKIILYTGHLYGWKGVDTLAEAAKSLGEGEEVYFVGGTKKDIEKFKENYGAITNIHIVGYRSHREIPLWQKAADVLVLPNTAREKISKYYTSPMKLFEYMASKTPIIASNIPSITEIANEENSLLVEPDDPEALRTAILWAVGNSVIMEERAKQALKDVVEHSWKKRAQRILAVFNK